MQVADTISNRSLCSRAQVGCVIVAEDQSVLAVSYNGPPAGYEVEGQCVDWCPRALGVGGLAADYDNCPTVHAEVNACARAPQIRLRNATAYSTRASCLNCCKTLAASGIVRLVHRVSSVDSHRKPEASEEFLRSCGIEVVRWND
jgi:dCMP deaminase